MQRDWNRKYLYLNLPWERLFRTLVIYATTWTNLNIFLVSEQIPRKSVFQGHYAITRVPNVNHGNLSLTKKCSYRIPNIEIYFNQKTIWLASSIPELKNVFTKLFCEWLGTRMGTFSCNLIVKNVKCGIF